MFMKVVKKKKGLLLTIIDDLRLLDVHKRAIKEMLMIIISDDQPKSVISHNDPMIDALMENIIELKLRIKELENSKNNINNSRYNSPNP